VLVEKMGELKLKGFGGPVVVYEARSSLRFPRRAVNSDRRGNLKSKPKPLPSVATGCRLERMVRERVDGSSPSEG
jgi:hypothetical protein